LFYARTVVRVQTVVAGLLLLATFVAGCGGSDTAAQTTSTPVEPTASQGFVSPLEERLGIASEPGRRQYQLVQRQMQADAAVVQCMRQAGFFYAVGSAQERFRAVAFISDESREFAATSGLGVTTSFTTALAFDASTTAPDAAANNLDYVASLTPEQAANYDRALVGQPVAVTTGSFEPAGCWGSSFNEVLRLLAVVDEFAPELATMNARLGADPRYRTLQQDWSTCMAAAGFRYLDETAMADDIYAQLLAIDLVETNGVTQVASPETLEQLASFERQVAVASFDCRQSISGELTNLRVDYEREFLDDNRFRIAEIPAPSSS